MKRRRRPLPSQPRTAVMAGAALVASAAEALEPRLGLAETRVFSAINGCSQRWLPVLWPPMQVGALGAVPVVALATWHRWRDPGEAARVAAAGVAAYVGAKALKRVVRRARPAGLHPPTIVRTGGTHAGDGYPSGHAAVVAAMFTVLAPRLSRSARLAGIVAVGAVGTGRIYVGAHLPADIVGGWSMGVLFGLAARSMHRRP